MYMKYSAKGDFICVINSLLYMSSKHVNQRKLTNDTFMYLFLYVKLYYIHYLWQLIPLCIYSSM